MAFVTVLLTLPWLWPFTPGPSPVVAPLLAAWACLLLAAGVLAVSRARIDQTLAAVLPASWLAAALLSAAIGLTQWFGVAPASDLVSAAALGEAYGNLRQRNQFASLMSLGLLALLALHARRARSWHLLAALPLAFASAASASRTGLVQWVVIASLMAAWPGPRRARLTLSGVALAAYAAAVVLLPLALEQVRGAEAPTAIGRALTDLGCSSRKVLWSNVLHLIAQRPWTGWGLGELDYAHYATLYDGPRFCDILDNAHNLPLHVAVELGVPAALAFVGVLAAAVWKGRPWREGDPLRQTAWAALVVIGLHSLVEYPLWYGPFQVAVVLCGLVLLRAGNPGPAVRAAAALLVPLALAGLALVYRAYDRVSDAYRPPEQRHPALRQDPVAALGNPPLFGAQLRFAELGVTPLTPATAPRVHALALEMLHYSPEPGVIEKVIESAAMLGRSDEVAFHTARFRAAFPDAYARWRAGRTAPPAP